MRTNFLKNWKNLSTLAITLWILTCISKQAVEPDKEFTLKKDSDAIEYSANFMDEDRTNEFVINLKDNDLLLDQNLYIVLESENTEFFLNIWHSTDLKKTTESRKVGTYSGNCLFVLGSGMFNGKLDYVRTKGKLAFSVKTVGVGTEFQRAKYKLIISTGASLTLSMGKIYTTMLDSSVNVLPVNLEYDGTTRPNLQKLRFQVNAIRTRPGWQMSAVLNSGTQTYQMNPVFKKAVGGILAKPTLPVCVTKDCKYKMTLKALNVYMLNIETFFIEDVETISIDHFEDYYDRAYENNKLTVYKLPFTPDMEELDVSISLIPVTGSTDLFVNVNTLPNDLNAYDFKEEGPLAKRVTVRWKQLKLMRATRSEIYIAVRCSRPGEYLIKVDAHEEGIRGTLSPGRLQRTAI